MREPDPLDALERYYRSQDDLMAPTPATKRRKESFLLTGFKLATPFAMGVVAALLVVSNQSASSRPHGGFESPAYRHEVRQELLAIAPVRSEGAPHPPKRHTMLTHTLRVS